MKVIRSARRFRLALVLFISLVLLSLLFRNPVQSYLAAPSLKIMAWLRLQYLSIPQSAIWLIFVMLAYLLLHASLPQLLGSQRVTQKEAVFSRELPLKKLVTLIEHSGSAYARRRLCQRVSELVVAALVERTGHSPHRVKAEIIQRRLELPEEVASYVSEGLQLGDRPLYGGIWRIGWCSRVDPRLYKTLEFLENETGME